MTGCGVESGRVGKREGRGRAKEQVDMGSRMRGWKGIFAGRGGLGSGGQTETVY